ncbi:MAG: hypothetical protein RLZZ519_854 [Bacteroidota bacterium]|jgi:hypothetical protein
MSCQKMPIHPIIHSIFPNFAADDKGDQHPSRQGTQSIGDEI